MVRNVKINQQNNVRLKKLRKQAEKEARAEMFRFGTKIGVIMIAGMLASNTSSVSTNITEMPNGVDRSVETIYANLTDLNDLDLVLVNDGVDHLFFNDFSEELANRGVSFQIINDSSNIEDTVGSETLISFLPYANPEMTKVICQYKDRDNQVDPLAIALHNCLKTNELTDQDIQCGIKSYNEEGVESLVPAPIEVSAGDMANRFVSVAVDSNTDVEKFADAFTEGMIRFQNYINDTEMTSNKLDLLTRVDGGQTLDSIAVEHNVTPDFLKTLNDMENDNILSNSTLRVNGYSNILSDRKVFIESAKGKSF